MTRGRHAAEDGSFNRSAGTAMGRGILLLAVAFFIGILLLNQVDAPEPAAQVTSGTGDDTEETTTTTTAAPAVTVTTVPLRQPKDVRVLTANGTTVKGAGGRIKDKVLAAGYNALAATDTKATVTASAVYFTPGFDREAAVIAQLLGLAPTTVQAMPNPVPVADLKAANVLVVVGPEIAQAGAGTSGSSTTTTARSSTSTTAKASSSTTTTKKP